MTTSIRSTLTAGMATIVATTIAVVPPRNEPAPIASRPPAVQIASPAVTLAALPKPVVTATTLPALIVEWFQRVTVPPSATAAFPTPQFPPVVGGTGIDSAIKNIYNAVEPWVRWGFEVAEYAVGWIPYVGWLAPQIMIFYNFGERIVRSITFNIADWIGGNVSFIQGLINVGIDTINSFIFLANDELAFWLPPLPPIPPIGPFSATSAVSTLNVADVPESTPQPSLDTTEPQKKTSIESLAAAQQTEGNAITAMDATRETDETTQPTAKELRRQAREERKLARQAEVEQAHGEVTETSTSTGKPDDATGKADDATTVTPKKKVDRHETPKAENNATDSPSPGPKTGKKDGTPKKDRLPKADSTDNE